MDKKKLISNLKIFIRKNNLKNSYVEASVGLPKNSLSNFLSMKKELPEKWVQPILKFTLGELSDKVSTADKILPPIFNEEKIRDQIERLKVLDMIENFCNSEGITPTELIEGYKQVKKTIKTANTVESKNVVIQDLTKENAIGKPYNPNKNPTYLAKIASKSKFSPDS